MTQDQSRTITTLAMLAGGAIVLGNVLDRVFPPPIRPGGDVSPAVATNADGSPQTANMTQQQANAIADGIEAALYGTGLVMDIGEDEATVVDLMELCTNDADVYLVMNAYGARGSWLWSITLAAAISKYLSASDRAEINSNFQSKGIAIRF